MVKWFDQYPEIRRLRRVSARRVLVLTLLCAAVVSCAPSPPTRPAPPPPVVSPAPPYDASLPPARAALLLAPDGVTDLRVMDWSVVRRDVGLPGLSSASSAADRAAVRSRIRADVPVLDPPLLAGVDAPLRTRFGFGADDVAWEAHWSGLGFSGWALTFASQVDMAAVARAVRAGVGPLGGAGLRRSARLVVAGRSAERRTLGADRTWADLVPDPGEAFLVHVGCLSSTGSEGTLDPLAGFSVTFGDHVATVRTDPGRGDLFARARLGSGSFADVFRHPVADPSSGRIGYDVPRPPRVVPFVRRGDLPFGTCAVGD